MLSILHDFAMIFVPLFVVVDPAGSVPVYLALTSGHTEQQRRRIAVRATVVAAITGVLFVILGQAVMSFLGIRFEDFQIAGGILVLVLALIDILSPGKPGVEDKAPLDTAAIGVVPLAVPLIVGPATMTTSLLLVSTYGKPYEAQFGPFQGQVFVTLMVCVALLLNLAILLAIMLNAHKLAAIVGRSAMAVVNKIVMILLAAIAVSLIRQGIVSIVQGLQQTK